jgi:hypothetical protein
MAPSESAETTKEAASARKARVACAAVAMPPTTGPTASVEYWITITRPLAAGSSSAGRMRGSRACTPGPKRPEPAPWSAASAATIHSGGRPTNSVAPSAPTTAARPASATSITTRGLRRSASAPPTMSRRTRGTDSATSTTAIWRGSPVTASTVHGSARP